MPIWGLDMADPVLSVSNLHAFYGGSHVLRGMEFVVNQGEVLTLLGRNGAGKTTTLKAIMGMLPRRSGSVRMWGHETISLSSDQIARLGAMLCPEERGIFASLTVRENLFLPPKIRSGGWTVEEIYSLFPRLKERVGSQGTRLSGGEQQMLAIARLLRTGAKMLLLDEPTEGLAPVIVQQIGALVGQLKERGYTIVLVEQNFRFAAAVADRHYVVERGKVIDMIQERDLGREKAKVSAYLGV